jgi:hypothetical protein
MRVGTPERYAISHARACWFEDAGLKPALVEANSILECNVVCLKRAPHRCFLQHLPHANGPAQQHPSIGQQNMVNLVINARNVKMVPTPTAIDAIRNCEPSVFGRNLQCQPVRGVDSREECHWSHACSLQANMRGIQWHPRA